MRILIYIIISIIVSSSLPVRGEEIDPQIKREKTVLSKVYTIDKIYKSMMGPASVREIYLLQTQEPELLWITGYKAVMKDAKGEKDMPQEFMCHSNLDFRPGAHRRYFGKGQYTNPRLFTLSQGQLEIDFPEGFGIPVISTEPLSLTTQVLNHNLVGNELQVRHQITIEYVRDRDIAEPLRPLFPSSAYGLVLLEGEKGYMNIENPQEHEHGPGCLPGEAASGNVYGDRFGRKFAGHWVVEPGTEINQTNVTQIMNLPYDTTIHYIAVHLHPYAESLLLRDLTTGETLFESKVRPFEDKIGIAHVDYFSSKEGIPVYQDHEYELVSVYNNTTDEPVDSMAVMYLYLFDKDFKRPDFERFRRGSAVLEKQQEF